MDRDDPFRPDQQCYAHFVVAAPSIPKLAPSDREQRFLVSNVAWRDYVILREALDTPGLRMTYLEGALELMSPSRAHERNKKAIARLIETCAFLLRLPLNGYGSTTFRSEAKKRGVEPDECWVRDKELLEGEYPQIVLEVIETSPLLDKLAVYDGFGVDEVWIFEDGAFSLHHRKKNGGYTRESRSALLPEIDFALVTNLAGERDQQTALEAHERALKTKPKRRR